MPVLGPWSALVDDQFKSQQLAVTRAQWQALRDEDRVEIKLGQRYVVGGPTTGTRGGRADWVLGRTILALDIDHGPVGLVGKLRLALSDLGVAAYLYPTISSRPEAPSVRILVPMAEQIETDDYHLAARLFVADLQLGAVVVDRASLTPGQVMFLPSHFMGEEPAGVVIEGHPWDAADALSAWGDKLPPTLYGETPITAMPRPTVDGPKAADTHGVIGAFNATFTVREAIQRFLPGIYEQHPSNAYRMRLVGKKSVGGLAFYEGDRKAFSFHENDPLNIASNDGRRHTHDAFSVVQIHGGKSVKAAVAWASEIPEVEQRIRQDVLAKFVATPRSPIGPYTASAESHPPSHEADPETQKIPDHGSNDPEAWKADLELTKTGAAASLQNVALIIANAMPHVTYNAQAGRIYVHGHEITDHDRAEIRRDIQTQFSMQRIPAGDFAEGLILGSRARTYHPLRDYLTRLKWDGKHRIATWLVDVFAVEPASYTAEVSVLFALGAVARAFEPGCQFDSCLVLVAGQGAGKGRFIRALAGDWYRELATDFDNDARMAESTIGGWIVEMAEMAGARKAEDESLKRYITRRDDRLRFAYAHEVESRLRSFVLVGTSNSTDFLRDSTGERRFWPVISPRSSHDPIVVPDQHWVDQFWAEAVAGFRVMRSQMPVGNLPLHLSDAVLVDAARVASQFKAEAVHEQWSGLFAAFLAGETTPLAPLGIIRDRISTIELWVECLGGSRTNYPNSQAQMVARAMKSVPGWTLGGKARVPNYGVQRVFVRTEEVPF
jgi:hypothetical protein|tara:strand:+ start:1742 stop:4078 length:2337 start_codon:yes stop_codon:yes gene_type:complete